MSIKRPTIELSGTNVGHIVSVCLQRLASTFLPTVEESLSLLEDKVMRSGTNIHSYYFLASTCALMHAKLPGTKDRVNPVEDASGRLSKLFYKIIALQDKSDVAQGLATTSEVMKNLV